MRTLHRLAGIRGIQWYCAATAVLASLLFTFVVFPAIADSNHVVLDPDWHGPLGYGIWKLHTFAYYPSAAPASDRGPLYPALIAALLALSGGWWPCCVQLAQCLAFGALCWLVFWMAQTLWSRPAAVLAAGLCALHPFLIWYTSRIWIETLMMLVFTALLAAVVNLKRAPGPVRAILVGILLGLCVLAKSIYAPFILLTPLLLMLPLGRRVPPGLAALVLAASLVVTVPWAARNQVVAGQFAPAVGRSGFTLHQGNDFIEDFWRAPFSVSALYPLSLARMRSEPTPDVDLGNRLLENNAHDAALGAIAMRKLIHSPGFLLEKVTANAFLFWTLGDSPVKSIVIGALQLPLALLFVAALWIRRAQFLRGPAGVCAALVVLFYLAHLPTIALARYSVVLVPAMLILVVGLLPRSPHAAVVETGVSSG
ncbi:MAG TPA: hypothetical protein VMT29_06375 [Steroidobacteraceae bacterium]|nr:hypothetical protein [Steroidobacteraceae bacterium]